MQQFADRFEGVTGSEIRKIFSLLSDPEIISFAGGNPAPDAFPSEELAGISSELIRKNGAHVLQYGATPGIGKFISYLKQENAGIMQDYDDIIIISGSTQGIELFARSMLNEGDTIVVESPTFLGALQTFKLARADVKTVDMQDDGPDIAQLEDVIKKHNPKFFYMIPTFQNPSGITATEEKRKAVYDLCCRHGVMILEDDPYALLRYEGQPVRSVKSYDDQGIVCRLNSYSKTISPGLRVGYAIAHKDVIAKFNLLKQGQDVCTSVLNQSMVLAFLQSGQYMEHVQGLCVKYKEKRDRMMRAADKYFPAEVMRTHPQGGLFIWVTLPQGMDSRKLFEESVRQKVAFVPGSPFFADGGHENTLRLNFSMPAVADIETGIERLGRIIREYD